MWSEVSTLAYRLISPCAAASEESPSPSSTSVATTAMSAASLDFDMIASAGVSSAKKPASTSAPAPVKPASGDDGVSSSSSKKINKPASEEKKKKKPSQDEMDEDNEDDAEQKGDEEDDSDDGQTVASTVSHANGKKKSKKRKTPFGEVVAKHLCDRAGVMKKTAQTTEMINEMILEMTKTIAEKAVTLAALQKRSTIQQSDIQAAVRDVFRTEAFIPNGSQPKKKVVKKVVPSSNMKQLAKASDSAPKKKHKITK